MISLFRKKKPKYSDQEYSDLSLMLTLDDINPTYMRELLNPSSLDFSLESLLHLDEYLKYIHKNPPKGNDFLRLVMRCGAYVGEVMRKNSSKELHWVTYKEAAKFSEYVSGIEYSIASVAMIWHGKESLSFPLGKICKFIENGSEDSVYLFAKVLLENGAMEENAL